jgi:NlpC/P60 family putative phage cell wall peptidase
MKNPRQELVRAARRWIGTPYRHQASCLGAGADCLGLIRGVWREVLGHEPELPPPYSMDWSEPQGDERLWRAAEKHLKATGEGDAPGQVLLFRMRQASVAKHLGILSVADASPRFVHAFSGHGVVESALTKAWRARIVARFDFPMEAF